MWKRINTLFNWLPLAALIEGKILCMHGGIGRCINRIEQIAELERPITMEVSVCVLFKYCALLLLAASRAEQAQPHMPRTTPPPPSLYSLCRLFLSSGPSRLPLLHVKCT